MTTQITTDDVKRIAALARLGLTDAEAAKMAGDLASALSSFSQIQAIDTREVPPASEVTALKNVTRPDTAAPNTLATPEALLQAAPQTHNNQIKVKAVFE